MHAYCLELKMLVILQENLNFIAFVLLTGDTRRLVQSKQYPCCHMSRYKVWLSNKNVKCHGKYVHAICIQGLKDLPVLVSRPELFVNKIYWDHDHYVMDCLEELILNKTVDDYHGNTDIDTTIYSELFFVKESTSFYDKKEVAT